LIVHVSSLSDLAQPSSSFTSTKVRGDYCGCLFNRSPIGKLVPRTPRLQNQSVPNLSLARKIPAQALPDSIDIGCFFPSLRIVFLVDQIDQASDLKELQDGRSFDVAGHRRLRRINVPLAVSAG
jgi:hypothetical protein